MENNISILIDFEMMFNEDYGMINLLVLKFNNGYLNDNYLKRVKYDQLMNDLLNQEVDDPLKLAFKDSIDYSSIYDELQNNYMKDIVELSSMTKFFGYITELMRMKNEDISITVLCKNKYEEQKIKDAFPNINIVNYDNINIKKYDSLYFKNYDNLTKIKISTIVHKKIYIANYKYNRIGIPDTVKAIAVCNDIEEIQIF